MESSVQIWLPYRFYHNPGTSPRQDATATVFINGTETEPVTDRSGVKHGRVTFTIYLCAILLLVRDRLPCGVEIDYRLDGSLFNLNCLRPKQK